jgi:broad specificity phosphatase PhoE
MERIFLLAAASQAQSAARVASDLPTAIDLVVTSPSTLAREAAATIVEGRWVFTVDEPLLAQRAPGESGDDVLGRLAHALRGLLAFDAKAPLVVLDGLDVLGAGVFALDEEGVMHAADRLEGLLPLP